MNRLGSSDIDVSVLGVGCLGFGTRVDQDVVTRIVDTALEEGVTFFDTADSYGFGASAQALGRALAGRRERVVVATKFGMTMEGANGDERARAGRRYMLRAVQGSLRRLGTDYIDLYQLHVPDRVTPIAETLSAMSELVDMGFVRAIGCSNLTAAEVESASRTAQSLVWRGSWRHRTSIRCTTGPPKPNWSRRASSSSWDCCPTTRWHLACSPASTNTTGRHRPVPAWSTTLIGSCRLTGRSSASSKRSPTRAACHC